jgi:KDO2-lipid IV(A) lauroyltransferase
VDAGFSIEGLEHITAERERGHGAVLGLPHVGGWDVGGAWFVRNAFPMTVVAEVVEPPELFEWFVGLREALGLSVVPLGPRAGIGVLHALADNKVVALLCDRDIDGTGIEVEFFGERTLLPSGPAMLALRAGCGLLPTAVYFDGDGHHAVVRPPIPYEVRGRRADAEDTKTLTQLLAHELEFLIRRAPAQWHMFQPNWPSDRENAGG